MLINLKTGSLSNIPIPFSVQVFERLPTHIEGPCSLVGNYTIQNANTHFLLTVQSKGELRVICQRCLHSFSYSYANKTLFALCSSDELAEKLMQDYECVVAKDDHIHLIELLTDDLYLYTPQNHLDSKDCNRDIERFMK